MAYNYRVSGASSYTTRYLAFSSTGQYVREKIKETAPFLRLKKKSR